MKKICMFLLLAMLLAAICACALADGGDSGSCGYNLSWSCENGLLTIYGYGSMYNYPEELPWESCSKNIFRVSIHQGVTGIGDCAFRFTGLRDVSIPYSVTKIGKWAFVGTGIQSMDVPNSVTEIGDGAFYGCRYLRSVRLPDYAATVGNGLFSQCGTLESVTLPRNLTIIGDDMFLHCDRLRSINLPETLRTIGKYAFACSGIREI